MARQMGLAGVMIAYPRSPALPQAAKELVVMRNGVYGAPAENGRIAPEPKEILMVKPHGHA